MGSASCIRNVVSIVRGIEAKAPPSRGICIVVSAMGKDAATPGEAKTTDLLLELVRGAEDADAAAVARTFDRVREKHRKCVDALFSNNPEVREGIVKRIEGDLSDIGDILRAVTLLRSAGARTRGVVAGYGELWSAMILSAALRDGAPKSKGVQFVDARKVVVVDEDPDEGVTIDWESSARNARERLCGGANMLVATGFIAADSRGVPTTLGRNGSDHSATIFARLLEAEFAVIWTDVDGVLTADPRRVPGAQVLDDISYEEAMELEYFGACILHPKKMMPVIREPCIPVMIKNTFKPSEPGTKICKRGTTSRGKSSSAGAHGFSTIDDMALVNLEGCGMIGVPGICKRLFESLHAQKISVTLVSQKARACAYALQSASTTQMRRWKLRGVPFEQSLRGGKSRPSNVRRLSP